MNRKWLPLVMATPIALLASLYLSATSIGAAAPRMDDAQYDQLMSELANYVAMHDALSRGDVATTQERLVDAIEDRFIKIVDGRSAALDKKVVGLRCALTRRIRELQKQGVLLTQERAGGLRPGQLQRMNAYFRSECSSDQDRK